MEGWTDGGRDGWTDGMDGRTDGRRQNYIPPTLSGDNNNWIAIFLVSFHDVCMSQLISLHEYVKC